MSQQLAHLLCPSCPGRVPFTNVHELTLHLSSAKHRNCLPYLCGVCGSRFGNRQSVCEHIEKAHPGAEEQPLLYDPPSEEEHKMLRTLVNYAVALQIGLIQPAGEGPTQVPEVQNDPINNQPPMVGPQRVLNRQPTPVAPQLNTVPEPNIAHPPAVQPAGEESVICADRLCQEQIPATYRKQCLHVLHNHSGQSETNFTAMMKRCFPEAREFHNTTCLDCGRKLTGTLTGEKARREQSLHVESYHLLELGVHLHCPVASCPDANKAMETRADLLRHFTKYHGGVRGLGREAKKAYDKMRKEAQQKLERETRRFFPFAPQAAVADANRRLRPNANDGGEEPSPKRVHFAKKAEVLEYEPDDYDDDAVGDGNMEEDEDDPAGDDGGAAGDDGGAAGDDCDEEEDEGDIMFYAPPRN